MGVERAMENVYDRREVAIKCKYWEIKNEYHRIANDYQRK